MSVINDSTPEQKYSKDGPFNDPVVICDSCQELLLRSEVHAHGMCKHCGNTRVRNVRVLSEENMVIAQGWAQEGKIDPDWLELFEVTQ
jgi:hypothetical protein